MLWCAHHSLLARCYNYKGRYPFYGPITIDNSILQDASQVAILGGCLGGGRHFFLEYCHVVASVLLSFTCSPVNQPGLNNPIQTLLQGGASRQRLIIVDTYRTQVYRDTLVMCDKSDLI